MYVGSRCWDSTSTATVGCALRISAAASSPASACRRHADVDDRDVREVGAHLEHQLAGVRGAPDDPVAGVLEQRRDALAQERVVVGDDDAERPRRARGTVALGGCKVA